MGLRKEKAMREVSIQGKVIRDMIPHGTNDHQI